ncbi:ScbR family autoregulator-binding transcription factor [Streptomyces coryli]|uniref:ScbR family autoregulator-binding transcription factor n=1 Tax=Streptomyces coryli TaxID=1128680 RepID=UPI0030B8FEA3
MTIQHRAAKTRLALIRSAAEDFAERGYRSSTLEAITRRAGVSTGALHFHFENKAALATAVQDAAQQVLARIVADSRSGDDGALQRLTDASQELAARMRVDVVLRAGFRLGWEDGRRDSDGLHRMWQECVTALMGAAQSEGALAADVRAEEAVLTIVAATTGFEALSQEDPVWISHSTFTGFWRLLLPSLACPEALDGLDPAGRQQTRGGTAG